jgi:hypothetical protein
MKEIKDFLGTPIHVGDRGVRVDAVGHFKRFVKVTIKEVNPLREQYGQKLEDCVGVVTDGNTKIGWTYPERIIVQDSFKVKI